MLCSGVLTQSIALQNTVHYCVVFVLVNARGNKMELAISRFELEVHAFSFTAESRGT